MSILEIDAVEVLNIMIKPHRESECRKLYEEQGYDWIQSVDDLHPEYGKVVILKVSKPL